jgi:hypothetical protein
MFVRFALLGDAVIPTAGKWNLLGNFDLIWAGSFPTQWPAMGLLLRIEGDQREKGEHELRIDFVDETGNRLAGPDPQKFTLVEPTVAGFPLTYVLGVHIANLEIPAAGNYDFVIRVDGAYLDSVPLYVRESKDHPRRRGA